MREREEFQTLLSSADNPGLGDFEGGKINPTTTRQSNILTKKGCLHKLHAEAARVIWSRAVYHLAQNSLGWAEGDISKSGGC